MTDVTLTDEKKPTDYDMLAEHIAAMEAAQAVKFNFWTAHAIAQAKAELERWFDEQGAAIPVENDPIPSDGNISPAEVIGAEGWYEDQGLEVSVARSNGCVLIRDVFATGEWYRDEAAEVAAYFAASERIIRMMGYDLLEAPWFMLPTHDISAMAAPKFRVPYTPMQPEVPFNDEEKKLFVDNFKFYHFRGAAMVGAGMQTFSLKRDPANDGELIQGHKIWTLANQPQLIIPTLMDRYRKNGWLKRKYHQMLALAHRIDAGQAGRVAGYSSPAAMGGERTRAWYDANEPTAVRKMPDLRAAD